MERTRFAALTAVLLAGLSHASAGAAIFSIAANGNHDWAPSSGAFEQSELAPFSRSGTLTDPLGFANVTGRSEAGRVGAQMSGAFTAPGLQTRRFDPHVSAGTVDFVTFSATTPTIEVSANLDFSGTASHLLDPLDAFTVGFTSIEFLYNLGDQVSRLDIHLGRNGVDISRNDFDGLHFDLSPTFRVSGTGITVTTTVPVGVTLESRFVIRLGVNHLSSALAGQSGFFSNFNQTFSYATDGPAFNLPPGATVNGSGIVDNRFLSDDDPPRAVPEPAGLVLLAMLLLILALRDREPRDRPATSSVISSVRASPRDRARCQ